MLVFSLLSQIITPPQADRLLSAELLLRAQKQPKVIKSGLSCTNENRSKCVALSSRVALCADQIFDNSGDYLFDLYQLDFQPSRLDGQLFALLRCLLKDVWLGAHCGALGSAQPCSFIKGFRWLAARLSRHLAKPLVRLLCFIQQARRDT
ncbi:hypothetical protein N5D77_22145 [Comamonas thiooxydans]|uniref:Uncharacterized protein n=1 Tax=Comamonas thiooxydans TaxID=363952 RepID=A0AA42Q5P3_9BURK|nr:hypothetical protein [Comamonas thiooxydans]MDH1336821.1 hypothetical protein [Comamonas thiooxydans]MDH1742915.1 hypothetical protein [Comamonas thiooxydans]MDH1789284.1 hypothetical protein [Comamonas thiooxydans]